MVRRVTVLLSIAVVSSLMSGCAPMMVSAVGVTLLGSDEDCKKKGDEQTAFSSLGCTGAKIRDAVMSPFSGDKKDSPATTPPKDIAPVTVVKPSKKKAPIIRKDRRKK